MSNAVFNIVYLQQSGSSPSFIICINTWQTYNYVSEEALLSVLLNTLFLVQMMTLKYFM